MGGCEREVLLGGRLRIADATVKVEIRPVKFSRSRYTPAMQGLAMLTVCLVAAV